VDVTVTTPYGTSATGSADRYNYIGTSPTVTGLDSASGPAAGGDVVWLSGTNFNGTTQVVFGGIAATAVTVIDSNTLAATAPAGSPGSVDVQVTNSYGTSTTSSADLYTYLAGPTVSGLSATSGPTGGGTSVTISGTGFTNVAQVYFGDVPASFTVNSATSISVSSPAQLAGTVDVTVFTSGGISATTSADQFTYQGTAPSVSGTLPALGPTAGGTVVTLSGANFNGTTAVTFGSAQATNFAVISPTQIIVTAPAGSAGTVDIHVTNPYGTSASGAADQFTYADNPAPTVTGLATTSGPMAGGTSVVLAGTNFTGAFQIFFGTTAATNLTVNSATQITVTAPAQGAGVVDVTVVTPYGTSATSPSDQFTYLAAAPSVTGISTSTGTTAGGTTVVVSGSKFTGARAVYFGTVLAPTFTVTSDSSLTVSSPVQAVGAVDITVLTPWGSSTPVGADVFTYAAATGMPQVTSLSTSTGPTGGGTTVTINGSGFTSATQVLFGSENVTTLTVNSDTSITVTAPPQSQGTIDVTVVTPNGISAIVAGDHFAYQATAPAVTGITPASGPISGGTVVTVSGGNFNGVTQVWFGSNAATSFTVNSAGSITATAPAEAAGTVHITVTSPYGTSATSAADQFTYVTPPAPVLEYVLASSGPMAGGSVVLTGVYLTGATQVFFGSVPASSLTVNSDTQITATAPAQVAGTVTVTVVTPSGVSAVLGPDLFTYNAATPTVSGLNVSSGPTGGGTIVTVSGSNFMGASAVYFGSTPGPVFTVNGDGSITAVSPLAGAGVVDVTVVTANGTSATGASDQFTYNSNPASTPGVTSLSVSAGPSSGGTVVTLTGTNLAGTTVVLFGSVPASSYTLLSGTSISAVAPGQAAGSVVDVTVTSGLGISPTSTADRFTYQSAPPTVTGVSANTATTAGGTYVTITGTNFSTTTAVAFGTAATYQYTVNSNTSITALVPIGAAGTVDVRVTNPDGTSAVSGGDAFTYTSTSSTPTVTLLSSSSGPTGGGTLVTITGTNFTAVSGVFFGTTVVSAFTVVSATSITATAPPATSGTVDVTVATAAGISAAVGADHFTYQASAPAVTAVSPSSGPTAGGTQVTITGSNFNGATQVAFGSTAATGVSVVSATQITATSPAGTAGAQDVTVTSPYGTSATSSADLFTYVAAPTVTGVTASSGTWLGGTVVTITGTNFSGLVSVSFGGTPAAALTVNSATQIAATTPAAWPGLVDVTVTTTNGTSALSTADQFTFTSPVTVTGVAPALGPLAGGTVVTITGSGFTGATSVSFGSVAITSFSIVNDSTITAVAPAAASAGPVDITVTNPGTTSATSAADLFYYASAAILTPAGFSSNVLPATDNGSTGSVALGFMVNFFGVNYTQVFVNNNGNVTFDAQLADYLPYPIVSTIHPMIAPFFADVDTRVGQVVTYGQDMVNGQPAFGVDWVDVGYNNQNTDKTNIFQLVLISRADIAPRGV
jgi:hypothetical protein